MTFHYLADHRELAPQLAALHYAEWQLLLPDWSEAAALAELNGHTRRAAIPTTLVMLANDGGLIGSVSLLREDDARLGEHSPWLASLLVLPEFRGRGHGAALVQRGVAEAATLGVATLYLYTAGQQDFYRKLGWRDCGEFALGAFTVQLMAISPAAARRSA
ncbi:MAG: GNAT family N-acetyltransferase [Lysobacterales bacterium CG_4_9_14_3_um_filter_62_6]|nr:MAG: GNAT family N-acetyltransferase [Xanthomonadales bacterium CG_4_9_14_3_um_filter_62_6]